MAIHSDLPIHKIAYDLLGVTIDLVKNMPRRPLRSREIMTPKTIAKLWANDSDVLNMLQRIRNGQSAEICLFELMAEKAEQALRDAKPVAKLHQDGYWTWVKPYAHAYEHEIKWPVEVYAAPTAVQQEDKPFQLRVEPWMQACFGEEIANDKTERNHRFVEEALELAQSCGCTASEAHQLVDYVFSRPVGERVQEVGGVMVTLAALCLAQGLDMHAAGELELERIWQKIDKIRAKQAAKPKHSPLPSAAQPEGERG